LDDLVSRSCQNLAEHFANGFIIIYDQNPWHSDMLRNWKIPSTKSSPWGT
jgi:hypothetical protein